MLHFKTFKNMMIQAYTHTKLFSNMRQTLKDLELKINIFFND